MSQNKFLGQIPDQQAAESVEPRLPGLDVHDDDSDDANDHEDGNVKSNAAPATAPGQDPEVQPGPAPIHVEDTTGQLVPDHAFNLPAHDPLPSNLSHVENLSIELPATAMGHFIFQRALEGSQRLLAAGEADGIALPPMQQTLAPPPAPTQERRDSEYGVEQDPDAPESESIPDDTAPPPGMEPGSPPEANTPQEPQTEQQTPTYPPPPFPRFQLGQDPRQRPNRWPGMQALRHPGQSALQYPPPPVHPTNAIAPVNNLPIVHSHVHIPPQWPDGIPRPKESVSRSGRKHGDIDWLRDFNSFAPKNQVIPQGEIARIAQLWLLQHRWRMWREAERNGNDRKGDRDGDGKGRDGGEG